MDHFEAPEGTEPIDVPYIGTEDFDRDDFISYPERKGWSKDELLGDPNFDPRTPQQVEAFFQTWLYFGMLISVFRIADIELRTEMFIRETSNGEKYITTDILPKFIQEWRDRDWHCGCGYVKDGLPKSQESSPETREIQATSIKQILEQVTFYAKRYCGERKADPEIPPSPISPQISMSIISLLSTLHQVATRIYGPPHYDITAVPEWPSSVLLKERMQRAGWCPWDISDFQHLASIDADYYFGSMIPPRENQNHSQCTKGTCYGWNVYLDQYRTKHVNDDCPRSCSHIEAEGIVEIIKEGALPLVCWGKDENSTGNSLQVVQYKPGSGTNWSDGMGNEKRNFLPICQLSRLQKMVDNLYADQQEGDQPGMSVPFWMDTLCVPNREEDKEYRRLTVAQMRSIYEEADAVLVLDSWIQEIPRSARATEKTVRLYLCSWRRRLWTLQEGFLAQRLYIQFKDGAQSIEDTKDNWNEYFHFGHGFYSTMTSICQLEVISTFEQRHEAKKDYQLMDEDDQSMDEDDQSMDEDYQSMDEDNPASVYFEMFANEIQRRATTRKSDETICLATLLNLDPSPLFLLPAEERMECLLRMVRAFNPSIIFNNFTRMQTAGFRWAPASFMDQSKRLDPFDIRQPDSNELDSTTLNPGGGLLVIYPGIKLGYVSPYLGSKITVLADNNKYFRLWVQQDEVVHWNSNSDYAVILYVGHLVAATKEETDAILGILEPEDEPGVLRLQHVARLWALCLGGKRRDEKDQVSGEYLNHDQRWCVV